MASNNKKHKPNPRRKAREYAVQALYQWQVGQSSVPDILSEFMSEHVINGTDTGYFQELLEGVVSEQAVLDEYIRPLCRQDFEDINAVELAILRIGVYEFMHKPDVPFKVVINEAVDLCKLFGAQDGYRFINGVLHQLAPRIREVEAGDL